MHPYIPELKEQYRQGKITRREFMRMAALLGLSMSGMATFLASCGPAETATPEATAVVPATVPAGGPRRGGTLRTVNNCLRMDDIATVQWAQYNVYRNVAEFLAVTDWDNVTVPWLLESWEPSEDLLTWTLNLRHGVTFNHGLEFNADDVMFNFQRWFDPDLGCSTASLMSYLQLANVEKVDDYTVRLHLDTPQIAVPEHLYHYNNAIMPRDFEGVWHENPLGTGPFTLDEFYPEERAILTRREGYWRTGQDGQALPYLDGIQFVALTDTAAMVAALTSGEVDMISINAATLDALEGVPDITISAQVSSYCPLVRMQVDAPPFDNKNVRNAIKACQDRAAILEATYRGYGATGEDHHVAPVHPEYCPMDIPPQDHDLARSLLAEAGYADGLEVNLAVINTEPYMTIATLLKAQCEPAGITINLDVMPSSLYWEQWVDVDFGITDWMHRPLGVMVLDLAYRTGVPWNETHFSNARFDELLDQAQGTYDVEARRELMCELQAILKEEGGIAVPIWGAVLWAHRDAIKNFRSSPSMLILDDVWMDEEA
ncbi:MAG: ABC transporter substrate-binding protein [Anaerolineae bacterium]|nr:ABC transporter substrate-binding protein [Anaerolineae bacterium]